VPHPDQLFDALRLPVPARSGVDVPFQVTAQANLADTAILRIAIALRKKGRHVLSPRGP